MKPVMVLFIMLFLVSGCVEKVDRSPKGFDTEKVSQACEQIIDEFQKTLKQELITAISEGGPENAIKVCNAIAPSIADSFSGMAGIDIHRVSLRQRNQQFVPDSFEISVLEKFASSGNPEPQAYSQVVLDSGKVKHFRFMKEIKIGQVCLQCHGHPDQFAEGLHKVIAEHYPGDKATGYEVGDSRGAFSVYVRYPEAEPSITELLSENGR